MFFHGRTIYGIRTQTIDEGNGSTFIYQLHRRSYVLTTPKTTPNQIIRTLKCCWTRPMIFLFIYRRSASKFEPEIFTYRMDRCPVNKLSSNSCDAFIDRLFEFSGDMLSLKNQYVSFKKQYQPAGLNHRLSYVEQR